MNLNRSVRCELHLSFLQEHQVNDALLKRRSAFEQLVGGILHRKQQWFHGSIGRDESEQRLRSFGLKNGLFLVRERTEVNSFALCLAPLLAQSHVVPLPQQRGERPTDWSASQQHHTLPFCQSLLNLHKILTSCMWRGNIIHLTEASFASCSY